MNEELTEEVEKTFFETSLEDEEGSDDELARFKNIKVSTKFILKKKKKKKKKKKNKTRKKKKKEDLIKKKQNQKKKKDKKKKK